MIVRRELLDSVVVVNTWQSWGVQSWLSWRAQSWPMQEAPKPNKTQGTRNFSKIQHYIFQECNSGQRKSARGRTIGHNKLIGCSTYQGVLRLLTKKRLRQDCRPLKACDMLKHSRNVGLPNKKKAPAAGLEATNSLYALQNISKHASTTHNMLLFKCIYEWPSRESWCCLC